MKFFDKPRMDDYFGLCPHCKSYTGYVKAGATDIVYCAKHKVSWIAGSGNFYSDHTEEEQRAIYDEIGIGQMERIERPFHWPLTLRERIRNHIRNWRYERRLRRRPKNDGCDIPF